MDLIINILIFVPLTLLLFLLWGLSVDIAESLEDFLPIPSYIMSIPILFGLMYIVSFLIDPLIKWVLD